MTKLIIITLVAVATLVALVWFRRRPVSQKPLPHDRRPDPQPPSKNEQASQLTDVDLDAPVATDERQEQSTETPHEPTRENSVLAQTHKTVSPVSYITEPASVSTAVARVTCSPLPSLPFQKPVPALPVELATPPLASIDVSCPPSNEAIPHEHEAAVSETDHTQPSSASPQVSNSGREKVPTRAGAPQSEPLILQTKKSAPFADAAHEAETATQTTIAEEKSDRSSAPLDTTAASPPAIAQAATDDTESETCEVPEPPLGESEPTPKAPLYQAPKPATPGKKTPATKGKPPPSKPIEAGELHVRLKLKFRRGVVILALVPDWRAGIPDEVDITGTQGDLHLIKSSGCYEDVPLVDASKLLRDGVGWQGHGNARRWRWAMGGRELYVLTSGEVGGLYPFGSSARLVLNAKHVVLATVGLREAVEEALKAAGCSNVTTLDEAAGVPSGWLLFSDVVPTLSVAQRDERDILNPLCPAHEIQAYFAGGVRLKHRVWLASHPPRIRFSGQLGNGFRVTIDGHPAQQVAGGWFEASGWNAEGRHRLWFGQKVVMYALLKMHEDWEHWHAHDFGSGTAICGATTHRTGGARWRRVCVPATTPLLIGAQPGEIFLCRVRNDVQTDRICPLVPFFPVWALPLNRSREKNSSARVILLEFIEPLNTLEHSLRKLNANSALRRWAFTIRNARRNQLALAGENEDTKALWRRYGVMAKQIWGQLR